MNKEEIKSSIEDFIAKGYKSSFTVADIQNYLTWTGKLPIKKSPQDFLDLCETIEQIMKDKGYKKFMEKICVPHEFFVEPGFKIDKKFAVEVQGDAWDRLSDKDKKEWEKLQQNK